MARLEVEALIDQFRAVDILSLPSVAAMREAIGGIALTNPVPKDITCEEVAIGSVKAEWVKAPGVSAEKVMLYFHGGGYVIGSLNSHRELVARLSRASGISALALEYGRAPERPFPTAVKDATAAYRWLVARGFDPSRIAIAGDSAGGGLAIAALVALRDAGDPLPACGVCMSPWVDLEATGDSYVTRAKRDPLCNRKGILNLAKLYLAGHDPRLPLAAPLHADLRNLPPLLIHVGEAETLYDDAVRIAKRAQEAGVAVVLQDWQDMPHVFQLFAPGFEESNQSVEEIGGFIAAHLG